MRNSVVTLLVLLLVVTSALEVRGATLAGVTLPDTTQVGSTTLVLNGLGVRKKFVVKVYVAGLYLQQKSSDANAILKADAPKRIVLHFVHDVSKSQLADGFAEAIEKNAPEGNKTMKPEIDRFLGAMEDMKEGEELSFTYLPGTGTVIAIRGKDKLTIPGSAFGPVLFSVWLGPKPPNADLKKGMLGLD